MFCRKCGAPLEEGDRFCKACGERVAQEKREDNVPPIDPSLYGGGYGGYQGPFGGFGPTGGIHQPPMKWYYFLIYFSLFAGAVLNVMDAFRILTGTYYIDFEIGNYTATLYMQNPGLRLLDIFYAVFLLLYAAFMVYTRFALSGFRRHGPLCLMITYVAQFAIYAVYSLLFILLFHGTDETLLMEQIFMILLELAVCATMILINRVYFNNRKHLFIK